MAATEAYCVKCRQKREMKDAQQVTMQNGRPATKGVCPVCGTAMFRIGAGFGTSGGSGASGESAPVRAPVPVPAPAAREARARPVRVSKRLVAGPGATARARSPEAQPNCGLCFGLSRRPVLYCAQREWDLTERGRASPGGLPAIPQPAFRGHGVGRSADDFFPLLLARSSSTPGAQARPDPTSKSRPSPLPSRNASARLSAGIPTSVRWRLS